MPRIIINLILISYFSLFSSSIFANTIKGKSILDTKEDGEWIKLGYKLVMSELQVLYSKHFNKPYSKNGPEVWHTKLNVGIVSKENKYYLFVGENNTELLSNNPDEAYKIKDIVEISYSPEHKLVLNSRASLEDMKYARYANFCLRNDEYQSANLALIKRYVEEDEEEIEYRPSQAFIIDEKKLTFSVIPIDQIKCECRALWCDR